jgi:formate transporter
MFFLPIGVLLREHGSTRFWSESGASASDFPHVTWADAIVHNLLPVTVGNVIGGSVMVGLVRWAVYLRGRSASGGA